MIRFFDENSDLIMALSHLNLLSRIAYLPTRNSVASSAELDDLFLADHAEYTTVYLWERFFVMGMTWLYRGKKETPQELFEIMKYMRQVK